jgi:hypothetical protein
MVRKQKIRKYLQLKENTGKQSNLSFHPKISKCSYTWYNLRYKLIRSDLVYNTGILGNNFSEIHNMRLDYCYLPCFVHGYCWVHKAWGNVYETWLIDIFLQCLSFRLITGAILAVIVWQLDLQLPIYGKYFLSTKLHHSP